MMNQSTLYVFLGISGFVLMFVALFYPRKKEKEEQAKIRLAWCAPLYIQRTAGLDCSYCVGNGLSYRVYRQKLQSYLCSEHRSSFLLPPV